MNKHLLLSKRARKQKGFTLIELIVVLLILAVFALIAIPAYMSTVDDARVQAANQAVAEGMYRLSSHSGDLLLTTGALPTQATMLTDSAALVAAGDYTLAYTLAGTTGLTITATGPNGEVSTGVWELPTPITP